VAVLETVKIQKLVDRAIQSGSEFELDAAVRCGIELVGNVDVFINATQPFKMAKDLPAQGPKLATVLFRCAEALRIASLLLSPAMPDKMAELWKRWNCVPPAGVPLSELAAFGGAYALKAGQTVEKGDALFMRADAAEPPPSAS
jgi:methionyl-tRNA synthetase